MQRLGKASLMDIFSDQVFISKNPKDVFSKEAAKNPLIIWDGAFEDPDISKLFSQGFWPIEVLNSMPIESGWGWKIKNDNYSGNHSHQDIYSGLHNAAGLSGIVSGNIHVALEIRDYGDMTSNDGNLAWWKSRENSINQNSSASIIFNKLCEVLSVGTEHGADLCVEGISIILNKDASVASTTLTSVLHTDRYCRPKEAGICSLMEANFEQPGGTLLLPKNNMHNLKDLEPITMDVLSNIVGNGHVIASESGDFYLYDGMDDAEGIASYANGIPHISGDISGQSSRLVIMIRNRFQGP